MHYLIFYITIEDGLIISITYLGIGISQMSINHVKVIHDNLSNRMPLTVKAYLYLHKLQFPNKYKSVLLRETSNP